LWGESDRMHMQNMEKINAYDCHQNVTEPQGTDCHRKVDMCT